MGLDPQTHELASLSCGPSSKPPASPSTRHMAQWESARLEAEARLSRESLLWNPHSSGSNVSSGSDVFLRLWNSEVGQSFRNCQIKEEGRSRSPFSQASSTKCASNSGLTVNANDEAECKISESKAGYVNAKSDSCSSNEMEDSSESALQLLLDYPSRNDMSFLEDHADEYSIFPPLMTLS